MSAARLLGSQCKNVEDFVASRHARYIKLFETFLAEQRQSCAVGASELKIQPNMETNLFQNVCCIDFIKRDGECLGLLLGSESVPGMAAISAPFGAAALSIDALLWDDVIIEHDAASMPSAQITQWFRRWFDPDDERHNPEAELSNIVHSLRIEPGWLAIDFGTAPTDAFWEMLELLEGAGARDIRIGVSDDEATTSD